MNDARATGDAERWLGAALRSLCSACRQVFGMPDYERYLAHADGAAPGRAGAVAQRILRAR